MSANPCPRSRALEGTPGPPPHNTSVSVRPAYGKLPCGPLMKPMSEARSTVWIIGGSSGIGQALAEQYAQQGHTLIISARRQQALHRVRAGLPHPERVHILPLDICDPSQHEAAVRAAWQFTGAVDVLVHSAGVTQRSLALETDIGTCRSLMEVNFFGVVGVSTKAVPRMLKQGRGHLVIISSVAGHVATPQRSTYAAAKHAIRAWADALRAELHRQPVHVTVICPGYVATGISALALTGDGTAQGKQEPTDRNGLDVHVAAQRMLRGIEARSPEFLVGGPEVHSVRLKRWAPGLVRQLVHRFVPSAD